MCVKCATKLILIHVCINEMKLEVISMMLLDVIVGVNKYKLVKEDPVEVRTIDNSKVLEIQVCIHVCTYIHMQYN